MTTKATYVHPHLDVQGGRITEDGTRSEHEFCGVNHEFFSLTGKVNINYIHLLLEWGRSLPLGRPDYIIHKLCADYLIFIVLTELHVSPRMYKDAPRKWLNWRCSVVTEVLYFTKHSSIVAAHIVDKDTGEVLATTRNKYVYVSRDTRLPKEVPHWARDLGRMNKDPSVQKPLLYKKPKRIPDSAFKFSYTMMYSDMDHNQHVNNVVYIRICMDAASVACEQGRFRTFKDNMYNYNTRNMTSFFARESSVGDVVEVVVWQDEVMDRILHFTILLKEQSIYYSDMEFQINDDAVVSMKSKY